MGPRGHGGHGALPALPGQQRRPHALLLPQAEPCRSSGLLLGTERHVGLTAWGTLARAGHRRDCGHLGHPAGQPRVAGRGAGSAPPAPCSWPGRRRGWCWGKLLGSGPAIEAPCSGLQALQSPRALPDHQRVTSRGTYSSSVSKPFLLGGEAERRHSACSRGRIWPPQDKREEKQPAVRASGGGQAWEPPRRDRRREGQRGCQELRPEEPECRDGRSTKAPGAGARHVQPGTATRPGQALCPLPGPGPPRGPQDPRLTSRGGGGAAGPGGGLSWRRWRRWRRAGGFGQRRGRRRGRQLGARLALCRAPVVHGVRGEGRGLKEHGRASHGASATALPAALGPGLTSSLCAILRGPGSSAALGPRCL